MKHDSKTASNAGMSAKLHCRAVGAPTIHFTWKRDDSKITGVSEKYVVEEKKVNTIITYGILVVNYACAYNSIGIHNPAYLPHAKSIKTFLIQVLFDERRS